VRYGRTEAGSISASFEPTSAPLSAQNGRAASTGILTAWTSLPSSRCSPRFEREGVRYAIFGAAALNLHGLARFTEDHRRLPAVRPPTTSRPCGERCRASSTIPASQHITADDLLGDYPAVQYVPPAGTFHLDLLTRLGEAFAFADLEVVRVPFDDLTVSVVSPRTLYRMKRDTVRLKDKADAALLKERFYHAGTQSRK
jgi:hypothetical protein